jgi:hypothetical protein
MSIISIMIHISIFMRWNLFWILSRIQLILKIFFLQENMNDQEVFICYLNIIDEELLK